MIIEAQEMPQKESFQYLGSIISKDREILNIGSIHMKRNNFRFSEN